MCGHTTEDRNVAPHALVWVCEVCGMRNRPKVQAPTLASDRKTKGKPTR
jgi:hypothetical protein